MISHIGGKFRGNFGGAPYNWAWLDEPVFGLAAMGVKPWLELSYGNSHYEGGGTNGPGASVPNSTVALTAWAAWVTAVAERYANVTDGKKKRFVQLLHFKYDRFTKTCSGQTQGKLKKRGVFRRPNSPFAQAGINGGCELFHGMTDGNAPSMHNCAVRADNSLAY